MYLTHQKSQSQPFTKEPAADTHLDKVLSLNPEMNGPWKWQGKEKPAGGPLCGLPTGGSVRWRA